MGRSTFAVPLPYHLHGVIFFTWVALFFTQNVLITKNQVALHRTLGMVSVVWVPLMVAAGVYLMFVVMQRTGGPFFFAQNTFFFSNITEVLCFALLTFAGLRVRRHTGWHRRLMLCGFAVLSNPGFGRLLPLPLLIPYAWHVMVFVVLVFPIAGMIRDKIRLGHVHPAWWWGVGAIVAFQIVADLLAMSAFGTGLVEQLIAGTPGAERPMEAFLPPGFAM
nr:hypothetical protein [Croceicoccus gelatinilyticus]